MPRIPEAELERIKRETDLIALIQSRGVVLKQQGSNWTGLCPFHKDIKTPNLIVTPGKGLFRCMAAGCGKTGNAIQFVQWHDGISFRHACEVLAHGSTQKYEQTGGRVKQSTVPKLPCPLSVDADESALLSDVASYYHERLSQNPAAIDYLKARGLDDEELIERFKIGFADRSLGLRMPERNRVTGAALREKLTACGVYRKSGHEHLTGCVVVPVTDPVSGGIVQLYGRRIDPKAPKDKRHLYLARPLAGVFNPAAFGQRETILCESILDALTFLRHGMEATCSFGTSNFGDELLAEIKTSKAEKVYLAQDADEAGEAAAEAVAKKLQSIGVECYRVRLPWGSDPNQFTLEAGGEALKKAVKGAEWLEGVSVPVKSNNNSSSLTLAAKKAAKKEEVATAPAEPKPERKGDYYELSFGSRSYRIGGLEKNNSLEVLKITLRLSESGGLMHVDALDLYRDMERRKFIERAAEETRLEKELIKRDLCKLLFALEPIQEERLNGGSDTEPAKVELSAEEEAEVMALLRSPKLMDKLQSAFESSGIVGEATNVLAAYLACASRKLSRPLAVIIQSTSAAGKTTLMEAVLSFFPAEEQIKYSAMTGQSLYYLGEADLKHKILAIVEEEGAEKASYALKLLQSEGELTIASTGKDPQSGRMETQEYHVEGPCAIVLTTTSIDIDEELMNRCLILSVDESKEQTERIHARQREARTVEGILANEERKEILRVMQNVQRLIKPQKIANPFARELTFSSDRTRTRRDHEKYLILIESIALLHQFQRETIQRQTASGRPVDMLPITIEDIEAANRIAPEALGRSLDELPPQTRRVLEAIKDVVRGHMKEKQAEQHLCPFSRREVREKIGWGETQTRRHLVRLEEMEYIMRRYGKQGTGCLYELLIDAGEPEGVAHIGLVETDKLRKKYRKK